MIPLKQKLTYDNGYSKVHFTGVYQSDYALCGQDLAGDSANFDGHGAYETASPTTNKVDCEDCIKIVLHCKSIDKNHIKP